MSIEAADAGDGAGTTPPEAATASTYTSVIYFHGMGDQRRFEETSRLIDKIDKHLEAEHGRGVASGMLAGIRAADEPSRTEPGGIVPYVTTHYLPGPGAWSQARTVRYYEVYWAPVMAGQKSPWGVLQWMARQQLRPFQTLGSPWRERQRLRRAALVSLFEHGRAPPPGVEARDLSRMINQYDEFEGLAAQRAYPKGSFKDFLAFIAARNADRPETLKRQLILAECWRRFYRNEELRNAFALITLGLVLLVAAGVAIGGTLALLGDLQAVSALKPLLKALGMESPTLGAAASLVGSVALLLGLGKFLTDYMGDVEAWATYSETDEKNERRSRILDRGMDVFRHVLADPRCDRVAVVSHSLGASIAHDTLLALARRNKAASPAAVAKGPVALHKIEHFVTMGSPIDKIEYFFESYRSASHRYKRVVEALRGDIGSYPFCANRHPHIHWVNFWDEGDAISGALQSPASVVKTSQQVDNVHVRSFRFPAPGASHSGYFENRPVISSLFQMIYLRSFSFAALPSRKGQPKDYESAYLGPGEPVGAARIFLLTGALTVWLTAAGLAAWFVGRWSGSPLALDLAKAAGATALLGAAALAIAYLHSARKGPRTPL